MRVYSLEDLQALGGICITPQYNHVVRMAVGLPQGRNWDIFRATSRHLAYLIGNVLWLANPRRSSESMRGICAYVCRFFRITYLLTVYESFQLTHRYFEERVRAALFGDLVQGVKYEVRETERIQMFASLEGRWLMSIV